MIQIRAKELIEAVKEQQAHGWRSSDLDKKTENLLQRVAHHMEGCNECQQAFDEMEYTEKTLQDMEPLFISNPEIESWVCREGYPVAVVFPGNPQQYHIKDLSAAINFLDQRYPESVTDNKWVPRTGGPLGANDLSMFVWKNKAEAAKGRVHPGDHAIAEIIRSGRA